MSEKKRVEDAAHDAEVLVREFLAVHRSAAIPALIGACVMWAVENGGAEVVKGSLQRASKLADEMERARRRELA